MKELYVLISWPEIQDFMEHERWEECIFCQEIEGHPCPDSTYAVNDYQKKNIVNSVREFTQDIYS